MARGGCSQAAAYRKCRLLSGGHVIPVHLHVAWSGYHWGSATLSPGCGDSPEPVAAVVGGTSARVSSIHLREVSFPSCCLLLLLLSHFSRVRLCDPIDGSPPGSPVPGILQARTLEWVTKEYRQELNN